MVERMEFDVARKGARLRRRPLHRLGVMAIVLGMIFAQAAVAKEVKRPRILGIASVHIYESDAASTKSFYSVATGGEFICSSCKVPSPATFELPSGQFVLLRMRDANTGSNFLAEVRFATDDLIRLREYFRSRNIAFRELTLGSRLVVIELSDPEGHKIGFQRDVPVSPEAKVVKIANSVPAKRIIHVGFVVKDRVAMDHFYRDILGFRLYWSGGMKEGETNWVAMQVPDGTDWIEYMLNVNPNADQRELGVMNHISLGVVSVKAAAEQLEKAGVKLPEEPKIGRDGKWQLNLYDPDWTRVELMEFTPVEKPCCSEFMGAHPKP